jgi:hypothetical protein
MAQFAIIAVSEVPQPGSVASGALVYRSPNVADVNEAVALFAQQQDFSYPVKLWAIPAGQLQPFRIDVTHQKSVVAE